MSKYQNISNQEALSLFHRFKKTGDAKDLATLYSYYMEMVLSIGLKYFRNRVEAEDLVMNVYEILYKKADRFTVTNISSWIYTIAKNECLMALRKQKKEIPSDLVNYSQQVVENNDYLHLFKDMQKENDVDLLHHCIDQLNEEQKLCVEQFYLNNCSYKEISNQTKFSLKQVKSYIQNGKRNLKNCMEKN